MPIYEYKCKGCKALIEKLRKYDQADDPVRCKACSGEAVRVISRSSFVLKGGGWAKDGYGS